jgi:hypothetical protein
MGGAPQAEALGALDAMAAGKVPEEVAPPDEDAQEKQELSELTNSMKEMLGLGEKPKKTKKRSSTKLSRILDELFMSDSERLKKQKEKEEPPEEEAPPIPGIAPTEGEPLLGPAPVGLSPEIPPQM